MGHFRKGQVQAGTGPTGQQQGLHSMGMAGSLEVSLAGRPHSILAGTARTEGPRYGAGSPGGAERGLRLGS